MTQNIKLHSSYNPKKEAERFCNTIKGIPKIIVVTEPGESYLAPIFRDRFPSTKIIAIRYTDSYFLNSDRLWDAVWRPSLGNLEFFIINNIPDEFLSTSAFLAWKPAEKIWVETATKTWKTISEAIKIMQSIIATRNFFGKRWYKNIINNFLFARTTINWEFTNEDSFLFAAGPSLEEYFDTLTPKLKNKFVIAVSSAVPALLARNIKPDLCISTDGGFWAANHLKNISADIPIAFPSEANIPLKILKKNNCLFLSYNSKLENFFLNEFNISHKLAKRNGTVAGTATDFLLDNTQGNIYIAGLDLKDSKGFSHIQPYETQKTQESNFNKLFSVSNFAAISNFDSRSLKTYAKWFSQIPINRANRLYRIRKNGQQIDNIKTITENEIILNYSTKPKITFDKNLKYEDKKNKIIQFYNDILNNINSGMFFKNLENNLVNTKITSLKESTIEQELCALISFDHYIQYIKTLFSDNNGIKNLTDQTDKLKLELTRFIYKHLKRFKDG